MTDEQNTEVPATQANEPKSDDLQSAPAASPAPTQDADEQEKSDEPEQAAS